jgi:two-component system NtrC family sensor kinase
MEETSRCSTIVRGLLEFSRQTAPRKGPANLNDIVNRTLALMRSQILLHRVNVDLDLDPDLPEIMIDSNKIAQVFTNIVLNAIDAMNASPPERALDVSEVSVNQLNTPCKWL